MTVALGWIALAWAGMAGAPPIARVDVEIGYTVRFVEVEGLGWREAVFTRLTPVTRQGAATVWTAPRGVAQQLLDTAQKDRTSRILQAPRVTARSGVPAHISARANQHLVTQVAWNGDDRATPGKPETVRTGSVATLTGRRLDQGILVLLVVEDTEIRAVHHVNLSSPVSRADSRERRGSVSSTAAAVKPQVFMGQGRAAGLYAYGSVLPAGANTKENECCDAKGTESPACCRSADRHNSLGSHERSHVVLPVAPLIAIPIPDGPGPDGTICELQIEGNSRVPTERIKAKLLSRVGQLIDSRKINADVKTLMGTRWFSDVQASFAPLGGKNILYFDVHELPASTPADQAAGACPNDSTREVVERLLKASEQLRMVGDEWEKFWMDDRPFARSPFFRTGPRLSDQDAACTKATWCAAETACPETACCTKDRTAGTVAIEVPEISSQEVAGEWLIPKDGILLVSFGPHTVADKDGKAVIHERLAIIEAEATDADAAPIPRASRAATPLAAPRLATPGAAVVPPTHPAAAPKLPMAVPALPSRSIPRGVHADGMPADLPTLPPDEAEAAPPDSSEARPSPQTKKSRQPQPQPKPAADSGMNKATYTAPRLPAVSSLFLPTPTVGLQFLIPLRPLSIQLPFNRKLEIEVYGRVVRDTTPAGKEVDPPSPTR